MGQANASLTKPRSTKRPNALRPARDPVHSRESLKDEDLPWRMSGQSHTKCFVRKLYRGHSIWHEYAWKTPCENNHKHCKDKEPEILFSCKLEPKKSRHLKKIDNRCRTIVTKLIDHRHAMRCDCDLEYITTGRTSRDTIQGSIICEKRDKAILKATTRHDKICGCGAFDFIHQKKVNSKSSRTPTSSKTPKSSRAHGSSKTSIPSKPAKFSQAHASPKTPTSSKTPKSSEAPVSCKTSTPTKTPIYNAFASVDCQKDPSDDDESDFDENIFKGIPRKF
ncbi:hypothetical protein KCU99_g5475, partial [Aureobasidium melanogenum]